MMNTAHNETLVKVLHHIDRHQAGEFEIARLFFNRRVLPARQALSALLWQGVIVGNPSQYKLSQMARDILLQATLLVQDSVDIDVTDI
jgi:hypothetical protein